LFARPIRIATGTIVDATIIHAPSSTKNKAGERDPEMHQTRKGNQWYFGLKAHIGVDSKEGVVHSVCTSAASVADKHMLPDQSLPASQTPGRTGGVERPVASETGLLRVQIKLRFDPNSTKSPHLQCGIAVTEESDPCADAPKSSWWASSKECLTAAS
jgi:hypothetical protein